MICSVCGQIKAKSEFTKVNKNKDGNRGLCKSCKKLRDRKYYIKKDKLIKNIEDNQFIKFELSPDILIRDKNKARIGVLVLDRFVDRSHFKKGFFQLNNFGLNAILSELEEPYEYCIPQFINNYDYVLVSLTSSLDVENIIYNFEVHAPTEIKPKIIIGGFGVININLIKPYIDIAVFGRAENQINKILGGKRFSNVWFKKEDPELQGHYYLRQPKYLVKGEKSVGCKNKCSYCQYTHTRRQIELNTKYNPGKGINFQETDWKSLDISKAGRYNTAWDGLDEETRLAVNKHITDLDIINKFIEVDKKKFEGNIYLKIYQIIGYPFEDKQAVLNKTDKMVELLRTIDSYITNNKFIIAFTCTPFEPQPFTPMQNDRVDIETNWFELLSSKSLYRGDNITAYISPYLLGSFKLMKRVFINRARENDLERFKQIAFNSNLRKMKENNKIDYLKQNGYLDMSMFGEIKDNPIKYLEIEPKEEKIKQMGIWV